MGRNVRNAMPLQPCFSHAPDNGDLTLEREAPEQNAQVHEHRTIECLKMLVWSSLFAASICTFSNTSARDLHQYDSEDLLLIPNTGTKQMKCLTPSDETSTRDELHVFSCKFKPNTVTEKIIIQRLACEDLELVYELLTFKRFHAMSSAFFDDGLLTIAFQIACLFLALEAQTFSSTSSSRRARPIEVR